MRAQHWNFRKNFTKFLPKLLPLRQNRPRVGRGSLRPGVSCRTHPRGASPGFPQKRSQDARDRSRRPVVDRDGPGEAVIGVLPRSTVPISMFDLLLRAASQAAETLTSECATVPKSGINGTVGRPKPWRLRHDAAACRFGRLCPVKRLLSGQPRNVRLSRATPNRTR